MRVAILGTGNISKEFMNASRIAEVEVCAVYHREIAKAAAFAENYGIPAYFDDYDEMLKEDFFDTVYTGLPNSLHYPYAKKALCAGKNVLIEKPFCSNLAEFDELVNLSHKHNVYLIEMDRVTSLPNFSVIRDHLGELGPIRAVTIDYAQYSRKYDDYLNGKISNVFTTEFSGGVLSDLLVYCVNYTVALFGKPTNLIYVVDKLSTGIDISGALVMKYPGFIATLTGSKNSIGDKRSTIQGEWGTIMCDTVPSVLKDVDKVTRQGTERISVYEEYDGTTYTLFEMKRIIDNDDRAAGEIRLAQSRKVMEVLQSARKSAGIVFAADNR